MKNYLLLATLLLTPLNLSASMENSQGISEKDILESTLMGRDMNKRAAQAQNFSSKSLKDVENFLQDNPDVLPHETIVILDLDGTLTNQSNPQNAFEAEPRGNAVDFVKSLVANKYKVVVSSAWNNFDETLGRVEDIGLAQTLNATAQDELVTQEDFPVSEASTPLNYMRKGLVTSVKVDDRKKYYINKAFSFAPTYLDLHESSIKRVVFADDSAPNIKIFQEDYKTLGAYFHKDCILYTFLLTKASGQKELE